MSSEPSPADDPGPPRRRSARHRDRDRVFVVPAWAPWGAVFALAVAMAGAFALGYRLGRGAGTASRLRPPTASPPEASPPRLAPAAPAAAPRPDAAPEDAAPPRTVATASTSTAAREAASARPVADDAMGAAPPSPEADGPTDGRWGVQVGAFPTRAEARARRRDLAWTDLPRYVVPVDLPGRGTWFRLRVGNFVDRDDAEAAARRIRRRSGRRPLVVRYP